MTPSFFDDRDLAEITSEDFPGERAQSLLAACPLLAAEPCIAPRAARGHQSSPRRPPSRLENKPLRGKADIGPRQEASSTRQDGQAPDRHRRSRRSALPPRRGAARQSRRRPTSSCVQVEPEQDASPVRASAPSGRSEWAFRSLKSVDRKVQPLHHRRADRVRAHVLLSPAYTSMAHVRSSPPFATTPPRPQRRTSVVHARAVHSRLWPGLDPHAPRRPAVHWLGPRQADHRERRRQHHAGRLTRSTFTLDGSTTSASLLRTLEGSRTARVARPTATRNRVTARNRALLRPARNFGLALRAVPTGCRRSASNSSRARPLVCEDSGEPSPARSRDTGSAPRATWCSWAPGASSSQAGRSTSAYTALAVAHVPKGLSVSSVDHKPHFVRRAVPLPTNSVLASRMAATSSARTLSVLLASTGRRQPWPRITQRAISPPPSGSDRGASNPLARIRRTLRRKPRPPACSRPGP